MMNMQTVGPPQVGRTFFAWVNVRGELQPRLYYHIIPAAQASQALVIHELTQENKEAIKTKTTHLQRSPHAHANALMGVLVEMFPKPEMQP